MLNIHLKSEFNYCGPVFAAAAAVAAANYFIYSKFTSDVNLI